MKRIKLYKIGIGQIFVSKIDDIEEEIVLPISLENDLILSLTKMRAYAYKIEVIEKDLALLHRARKKPYCHLATANLIAGVLF